MSKNYTAEDIENVASAIKDGASWRAPHALAEIILEVLYATGRITPPWEPCQRSEIKKGDRYRAEDKSGAVEDVAGEDFSNGHGCSGMRYFRIPAPAPAVEWPEEPGPYLVTWKGKHGNVHEDMWMILEGEDLRCKGWVLFKEHHGDVFTLLSVKKGGATE